MAPRGDDERIDEEEDFYTGTVYCTGKNFQGTKGWRQNLVKGSPMCYVWLSEQS